MITFKSYLKITNVNGMQLWKTRIWNEVHFEHVPHLTYCISAPFVFSLLVYQCLPSFHYSLCWIKSKFCLWESLPHPESYCWQLSNAIRNLPKLYITVLKSKDWKEKMLTTFLLQDKGNLYLYCIQIPYLSRSVYALFTL